MCSVCYKCGRDCIVGQEVSSSCKHCTQSPFSSPFSSSSQSLKRKENMKNNPHWPSFVSVTFIWITSVEKEASVAWMTPYLVLGCPPQWTLPYPDTFTYPTGAQGSGFFVYLIKFGGCDWRQSHFRDWQVFSNSNLVPCTSFSLSHFIKHCTPPKERKHRSFQNIGP